MIILKIRPISFKMLIYQEIEMIFHLINQDISGVNGWIAGIAKRLSFFQNPAGFSAKN